LPQSLLPRFNLSKKPGFFHPPHKSETGFLSPSLLPSFDLSKKPGFFHPRRKNSVSLALVRAVRLAVRRCEIVDLICKLQMATHPTILNRVQR
jgi:hypothetical protein